MKKVVLLLCCTFSVGAYAANTCKHAPIPKIKGKLGYEESYRSKVIKSGWTPVPVSKDEQAAIFYDKKFPERTCGAPSCYYSYKDKSGNTLFIASGDVVTEVILDCKK